ncbi:hypothetical protein PVAP13_5KG657914 [Panicum virgatum]|uniref:Uncharacterized protein n=1 Tax=Panicum virgatum TaxID=38727 RepID=A0A8T0SUX7_PANVG|nr:hypothetical protein PVAP13_5KG657914 [Panicum virgatum]
MQHSSTQTVVKKIIKVASYARRLASCLSCPLNASSRLHMACWEELTGSTGHPQMQTRSHWLRGDASYETVKELWPSLIARREGDRRYASWSPALHSCLSLPQEPPQMLPEEARRELVVFSCRRAAA